MKFAAAILGVLILVTSAFPVPKQFLSANKPMVKCHFLTSHCNKMKNPTKKTSGKEGCNNGACNPFSVCNTFPVVVSVFPAPQEAGFIFISKMFSLFNATIYSGYCPECWHPPNFFLISQNKKNIF